MITEKQNRAAVPETKS